MSGKNILMKIRPLIFIVLMVTVLIGTVQIIAVELDFIHLSVTVVRNDKVVPNAKVYVFAVMPNGTCFITKLSTGTKGVAGATLSIREIIKPMYDWNKKEKEALHYIPVYT